MDITSLWLLAVSTVSILTYLTVVVIKFGIQPSISESYYRWHRNVNIIFTLALWAFAMPIILVSTSGFLFFAGSFICVVGTAQNFKNPFEGKAHAVSAIVGISLGMASLIIDYHNWVAPIIFATFSIFAYLVKIKNLTWWVEVAALICIETSLFKHYITLT
jgi:hypothetical protein